MAVPYALTSEELKDMRQKLRDMPPMPEDARVWQVTITSPTGETSPLEFAFHPGRDPLDDYDKMRGAVDTHLHAITGSGFNAAQMRERRLRLRAKKD